MGVQHRSGMYLEARLPLAFIARGMQSEERIQSRPTVTKRSTRFFCRGVSIRVTTSRDIKPSEGWHGMATGTGRQPDIMRHFQSSGLEERRSRLARLSPTPTWGIYYRAHSSIRCFGVRSERVCGGPDRGGRRRRDNLVGAKTAIPFLPSFLPFDLGQ